MDNWFSFSGFHQPQALSAQIYLMWSIELVIRFMLDSCNMNAGTLLVLQLLLFSKGGTFDVTAHDIWTNGNINEIHQVTGELYGGTKVDEEFVSLLERFFGIYQVKNFRENHPAEWLEMLNEFEMKKRGRQPEFAFLEPLQHWFQSKVGLIWQDDLQVPVELTMPN